MVTENQCIILNQINSFLLIYTKFKLSDLNFSNFVFSYLLKLLVD